jgi:hypothetical protein
LTMGCLAVAAEEEVEGVAGEAGEAVVVVEEEALLALLRLPDQALVRLPVEELLPLGRARPR